MLAEAVGVGENDGVALLDGDPVVAVGVGERLNDPGPHESSVGTKLEGVTFVVQ